MLLGFALWYNFFYLANRFTGSKLPVLASKTGSEAVHYAAYNKGKMVVLNQGFNVLLLGIDARKSEQSRTDLIMVAHIEPLTGRAELLSVPRDTRARVSGVGYTKINHAHLVGEMKGGISAGTMAAVKAVSEVLQCDINYYVKVNFTGFKNVVNLLGGLDIQLSSPVKLSSLGVSIPSGKSHIDGDIALALVRERHSLADGDFGRQRYQFLVLKAMKSRLTQPENIGRLPMLIRKVRHEVIDTNFSNGDLVSLAWMLKEVEWCDVDYKQVPGRVKYADDPLVNRRLCYWEPDMGQLRKISDGILKTQK